MYSVVGVAVPDNVNGIVMSFPDTTDGVAVNVTVVAEFSTILLADKAKVTVGNSSLSVIVTVIGAFEFKVAFDAVPGVRTIVSSTSSVVSSIPVRVIVPVALPARIFNCGDN